MDKILIFNGNSTHYNDVKEWIKELSPELCLICETGVEKSHYRELGKIFFSKGDTPTDVSVLLMKRHPTLSWFSGERITRFIHRGEPKPMLWRDRWYARLRVGTTVNYSIHANAVISHEGTWLRNKGAEEWKRGLVLLRRSIAQDINKGRKVRVGGDMNFPRSDADLSPNKFFEGLHMESFNDGVMWFAWDPRKERALSKRVLHKAPGADAHHSLLVRLERLGK